MTSRRVAWLAAVTLALGAFVSPALAQAPIRIGENVLASRPL